ncbi:MAG: efflux RND transporter permease subunit, partial [Planctomycetales bacterium]|nr:efflux RND transporter permease subunit [Planctomycetales bacterium]
SVMASVTTTIIAFSPLFFVSGVMGKFIAVMPFAVIAMLVISLLESMFVLPTHLAHDDSLIFRLFRFFFYPLSFVVRFFARVNAWATMWLARFIDGPYSTALTWAVRNPWSTISGAFAIFLITVGMVIAGLVPFNIFPKLDSNYIIGNVTFPDGTPTQVADDATMQMANALREVCQEFGGGTTLLTKLHRNVGSLTGGDPLRGDGASGGHVGSIDAELVDTTLRSVKSDEIIAAWRKKVGPIPGTDSLRFGTPNFGPGGKPVEFKLLANSGHESYLEPAIEDCKEKLANYAGVFDIEDDSRPGKIEFQIEVKDDAKSLGISTQQLIDTVRSAYYGAEVMRLQRGRHEVKLMVRYPKSERSNFASFDDIRIRTGDGEERPITEIAEIQTVRGFSEINRLDQKRSVTISADLDETVGNARNIVADLKKTFEPELLAKYPGISVRWEGQQEQTQESLSSLGLATVVALFVMFVLLTLEFRSYLQPLIIMMIIPFGVIGAILGHWAMGLPLTLFSFFGLVALTGVVVNDSIVLVDFINHRVRAGLPIEDAVIDAGKRRFRPVLLTSATTVAGLAPILMESSFQAQILIPMATSLGFGLLLATILVLLLVPTLYKIYRQLLPVTDDELEDDAAPILTSEATLESAATT